jgi:hypothetical protein
MAFEDSDLREKLLKDSELLADLVKKNLNIK